jgi:hypothetical protein
MADGVNRGVPPDWSWDDGVTADEAWQAARNLLDSVQGSAEEE